MKDSPSLLHVTATGWVKLADVLGGMLLGNDLGEMLFIRLDGKPESVLRVSPSASWEIRLWRTEDETPWGEAKPPSNFGVELQTYEFRDPKTGETEFIRVGWTWDGKRWLVQEPPKDPPSP